VDGFIQACKNSPSLSLSDETESESFSSPDKSGRKILHLVSVFVYTRQDVGLNLLWMLSGGG
jgi:hypothetical protein